MTDGAENGRELLPPLTGVRTGCLCCAPKPDVAPMDWQPHPGFGVLYLKRDGETPEWWDEYCDVMRWVYVIDKGWTTLTNIRGEQVEYFDGEWWPERPSDAVTMGEIEECCAEDPDHDWRLEIHGPLGGAVYQRQGCAQWVPVERLDGFA